MSNLCVPAAYSQTSKPKISAFKEVWSHQVEPIVDLKISPQGRWIGIITRSGKLSIWDSSTGIPIWSVRGITQHNLIVSDTNSDTAVYDSMNRIDRSVQVFTGKRAPNDKSGATVQTVGHRIGKAVMDGAVWSADVSPDGTLFAFGNGARQVRLIEIAPAVRSLPAYPVDGIAYDTDFSYDSQKILVGLWNQSGVEALDRSGHILTSYLGPNVRRFNVSISPGGENVLALSSFNRQNEHPVASLLSINGVVRWSFDPGQGTSNSSAMVGNNGQVSYLGYTKIVHHPGKVSDSQRFLTALDGTGNQVWVKGGLFMQPKLVCLAPDGVSVIFYDGDITLYKFASNGSYLARFLLPSKLQQIFDVSRTHKILVAYLADGTLERIDIN